MCKKRYCFAFQKVVFIIRRLVGLSQNLSESNMIIIMDHQNHYLQDFQVLEVNAPKEEQWWMKGPATRVLENGLDVAQKICLSI